MSAVFTLHAVERMRERGVRESDRTRLLDILERVADEPDGLERSDDVVRVERQGDKATYIIRAGDLQAVVTVDPVKPEQVIVATVYRAEADVHAAPQPDWKTIAQRAS